jgi:hypothetical protein
MASSGILRRVALVRTDVSEELSAYFIRVTRIGKLGTTLAVTSNRRTLRRKTKLLNGLDWSRTTQTTGSHNYVTAIQKKTPWPLVRKQNYRLTNRHLSTKFSSNFYG